jgi:hypothetical protein
MPMARAVLFYRHIRHVPKAPNFWGAENFEICHFIFLIYIKLSKLPDVYKILGIHFDKNTLKMGEKFCVPRAPNF